MQRSMMMVLLSVAIPLASVRPASAVEVVDSFDAGDNPDGWSWLSGSPSTIVHNGTVQPSGGNPGGWFDSGTPYFSDHPNFSAVPEAGTPLRAALDSGALQTMSVDFQRLDTSAVQNCHPVYDLPSTYTLELLDLHTLNTDPPTPIVARTTDGPASPAGTSYPWTPVSFTIPSDATDVPPGWELDLPPDVTYTWSDMMHNVDAISVFVLDPSELTFDSCWQLGADNVAVGYGLGDAIFADGFEGLARRGRSAAESIAPSAR
jgi:hypothetical protein